MVFSLATVAAQLDVTIDDVRALVLECAAPLMQRAYYIFVVARTTSQSASAVTSVPPGVRSLALFRSPDDALAFTQQAQIPGVPQVRPITREAALLRLLGDPLLAEVLFFEQMPATLPYPLRRARLAHMDGVVVLRRPDLLVRLGLD